MNTSTFFRLGDVVSITLTKAAWPYETDFEESDRMLMGRVIFADALGIAMVDGGGETIMPTRSNTDNFIEYVSEDDLANFYPWHSVEAISLVCRSDHYIRRLAGQNGGNR